MTHKPIKVLCRLLRVFALSFMSFWAQGLILALDNTPSAIDTSTPSAQNLATSADAPVSVSSENVRKESSIDDSGAIVNDIIFKGNSLNKSKTLEKKIKTRRKKPLDKKQLKEDIKLLFETGDFDDVTVDVEDLPKKGKQIRANVIFMVVERAIIKRIDYKGDRQIHSSAFSDKVQSQEGNPYDKYKASIDSRAILEYYRDEGYAGAQVEYYTTLDAKNKQLILTFFITEGQRILIGSVDITGTKFFKTKKIAGLMKSKKKKVLKDANLREDESAILDFYKNNGFLDVKVSTISTRIDEEKNTANLSLTIEEGPRYVIGTVDIASSTIFTQKELKKAVTLKKKELFKQTKLDESVANIHNLYADKGYLRTEIIPLPQRDFEHGIVNFNIDIHESSIVYVDGVYVDGNNYTKTYVIKREVLMKQGDIFSASKMRRSVEKIYNLGFLDDVNVDIQQPRSPDLVDLIFSVKEGKPGVFSAGVGYSSVDHFVGNVSVSHNNLFGRAQKLDVSYEFGSRVQNFTIGWTDPWFLGYKMSGGVDLFNTVHVRDYPGYLSSYREKRQGASFRLGPRLSDDVSLLFAYTLQNTEIYGVNDAIKTDLFSTFGISPDEAAITDSVKQLKSSMLTELADDTRDNRFDATRGGRHSASVEVAGGPFGGDINYLKPQVASALYFPTFWKFVFSLSGRMALVKSFMPSSDVPTSDRFSLGGPDTVRGYDINSIAPPTISHNTSGIDVVKYNPGRIMALFNAEYKFPIVQEHNKTIFQGAFFMDVGGVWEETDQVHFTTGRKDDEMKAGVGFGFRFKTPVFPIRLDFGVPLNPRQANPGRPADKTGIQPYFTIGNIF